MNRITFLIAGLLLAGTTLNSCKDKKDTPTPETTTEQQSPSTAPQPTTPVIVNGDDALTTGLRDATKDFPGVSSSVNDGEVTLTGTVDRSRLPVLMQSIQALHPKKVVNNLTIK